MRKTLLLCMALCVAAVSAPAFDLLPQHQFVRDEGKTGVPTVGQGWMAVTNDDWMNYIIEVDENSRRINVWPSDGTHGGRMSQPGVTTYVALDNGFWSVSGPSGREEHLGVRPGQTTAMRLQGFSEGNRYGTLALVNEGHRERETVVLNPMYRNSNQLPYAAGINYPYMGPPEYINPPGPGPAYLPPAPPPPPPYYPPYHHNPPPPPPPPPPYHHYGPTPPLGVPPYHQPEPNNPVLQHRW